MNRKYYCHDCKAGYEHDSDEPLDECLKCDGDEDGDYDLEYSHKCPYCDLWMEYDLQDGVYVCRQCNSYFDDDECIAFTLKCLAFYDARKAKEAHNETETDEA